MAIEVKCLTESSSSSGDDFYLVYINKKTEIDVLVRSFLCDQVSLCGVSMDVVATSLCMSSRTLSRKLSSKKISFSKLLNEERKRRCFIFLENHVDNGADISDLLGISNPDYFYQVFKKWTGFTFSQYKRILAEKQVICGEKSTVPN